MIGRFINADAVENLGASGTAIGQNLFAYCENNPISYRDDSGCIPKKIMNMVNALNVVTIMGMFAYALYMTPTAALTKIGLYVTGVLMPKVAAALWHQPWAVAGIVAAAVGIVLVAVSAAHSKALKEADQRIRETVKRNSKYQYWSANLGKNGIDIGRPLTFEQAVLEVAAGRNVFTVTSVQAAAVAKAAGGGREPMFGGIHGGGKTGYYYHYHVYGHENGAHVWYLF